MFERPQEVIQYDDNKKECVVRFGSRERAFRCHSQDDANVRGPQQLADLKQRYPEG